MTTQLPYPPQPQPPAPAYQPPPPGPQPAYSTAPPWATPPAGPQDHVPPPPPFGDPRTAHGQLLVPYPEEMQAAARPIPPSWWPILPLTFFFGVFALISVVRRATMANRGRNSVAPYWLAWGLTMVVGPMVAATVAVAGMPAYFKFREGAITKQVQENIVKDGTLTGTAQITATTANCEAVGMRDATGIRLYDCALTLDDGRTGTMVVTADSDGKWSMATPKKK